jgi:hypothetical protein
VVDLYLAWARGETETVRVVSQPEKKLSSVEFPSQQEIASKQEGSPSQALNGSDLPLAKAEASPLSEIAERPSEDQTSEENHLVSKEVIPSGQKSVDTSLEAPRASSEKTRDSVSPLVQAALPIASERSKQETQDKPLAKPNSSAGEEMKTMSSLTSSRKVLAAQEKHQTRAVARHRLTSSAAFPSAQKEKQHRAVVVARRKPTASSAVPPSIQQKAVQHLLKHFISAYQQGDLDGFIALFSPDAHTNDYFGKPAIRQDYARFFSSTQARELYLKDLQWRIKGNTAQGGGRYIARVRKASGIFESRGLIHFQVQNQGGTNLITRFFNTIDSVQRDVSTSN